MLSKSDIVKRFNNLCITVQDFTTRHYGVSVKHFKGTEEQPFKRIDYALALNVTATNDRKILEVNKTDIYYNQHEADLISEQLATAASEAIYPLKVAIDEKGTATGTVLNLPVLNARWQEAKRRIGNRYESPVLETFYNRMDAVLSSKAILERSLSFDWFWNLMGHPRITEYGTDFTAETDLWLSIVPYGPLVQFKGIQSLQPQPTDYYSFTVTFESVPRRAPAYFYPSGKLPDDSLLMSVQVIFDLDVFHIFPMHTRCYLSIYTQDPRGNKTIHKRIHYTQYQQNTAIFSARSAVPNSIFSVHQVFEKERRAERKWGFSTFLNDDIT